jgi:hypothetical protein
MERISQGEALRRLSDGLSRYARRPYEHSVIRRAMLLGILIVPAFGANFLVQYLAAALWPAESYGIFYVAWTLGNILLSGSLILNVFFTRHIASILRASGRPAAFAMLRRIESLVLRWGAVFSLAAFAVLQLAGARLGAQSWLVLLLTVLDSYTAYVVDLGRVMLQSLRQTLWLGFYSLVWMVARLLLFVLAVMTVGTVASALAGVVLASLGFIVAFHLWVSRNMAGGTEALPPLPRLAALLPVAAGYGLLMLLSNLDILLGYVLLSQSDLGIYSGSSVFPKGLLVLLMPVLQMLFPMMLDEHLGRASGQDARDDAPKVMRRTGGLVVALAGLGAASVWLLSGLLCGGWGIRLCSTPTLGILLLSVLPLAVLRFLVLFQLARGRDRLALWLFAPTAVYVAVALLAGRGIDTMAQQYVTFSVATAVLFAVICLAAGGRQPGAWRQRPAAGAAKG